jgi:predicted NUDIX family NTP pyrophosphohydrolase
VEIEWPPRSGRRQRFPEIDRIAYFTLPVAETKILAYQRPLLHELEPRLGSSRA